MDWVVSENMLPTCWRRATPYLPTPKTTILAPEFSTYGNGATRRYIPDFLVRLSNGKMLVLEIKGEDSEQNRAKRSAMEMWVAAVNAKGGFGIWSSDVAYQPAQLHDVLTRRG